MKEILKSENIRKIEFWAATTIFVFAVFVILVNDFAMAPNKYYFDQANIPFHYYKHYFFPQFIRFTVIYLAFLLLNFYVVPKLIEKKELFKNLLLLLLSIVIIWLVFATTDTYLKNYLFRNFETEQAAYNEFFINKIYYTFWLLIVFGIYTMIRYSGVYLLLNSEAIHERYKFIPPGAIGVMILWMISMFLLLIINADGEWILGWGIVSFTGIAYYWYSFYYLIPHSLVKKRAFTTYIFRSILFLILLALPIAVFLLLITNEDVAMPVVVLVTMFHIFFTAPLLWIIYKRMIRGNEEIYLLKKELGQSTASFDFLRSQINPHFLFNALNTIYGTAIQEKAERTSEGIEKLGDMMRFMLQENIQDKISLSRELEYLNNYIGLQKLRTDSNPNIKIQTQIEDPVNNLQISPMLLIPFVENAFKHGISFREPSYININLELKDNTLYFDVYNSKHQKQENDPEKYKSGIGLNNVKQRLQLLYKNDHELIIRETGKEYFIHLTLKLS